MLKTKSKISKANKEIKQLESAIWTDAELKDFCND